MNIDDVATSPSGEVEEFFIDIDPAPDTMDDELAIPEEDYESREPPHPEQIIALPSTATRHSVQAGRPPAKEIWLLFTDDIEPFKCKSSICMHARRESTITKRCQLRNPTSIGAANSVTICADNLLQSAQIGLCQTRSFVVVVHVGGTWVPIVYFTGKRSISSAVRVWHLRLYPRLYLNKLKQVLLQGRQANYQSGPSCYLQSQPRKRKHFRRTWPCIFLPLERHFSELRNQI